MKIGQHRSEPCLAFNRTIVLRYRIHLEQRNYRLPSSIFDWQRFGA